MAERKRRTDEHRRADVAVKVVQLAIARAGHVSTVGDQGSDYGTDVSVQTFDDAGYLENGHFAVQVKSTARPTELAGGRTITHALDRRDLDHWLGEPWPVILVVYDSTADLAYWAHVQGYFMLQRGFSLSAVGHRVTIRIEKAAVFSAAAVSEIRQLKLAAHRRLARRFDHG